MKQVISKFSIFLAFIYVFAMVFSSCSTSESVVSNGFLQKRKYNKGFHKTGKNNIKVKGDKNQEVLVLNNAIQNDTKIVNEKETTSKISKNKTVVKETIKEVLAIKESSVKEVSTNKNTTKEKNKVVEAIENKVEKVTSALKNESILNTSSNTSSNTSDDMMILLIILAIIIPFVAVGIYTDWDVTKTVIALILTLLFFLPGMIYALLTIFDKI